MCSHIELHGAAAGLSVAGEPWRNMEEPWGNHRETLRNHTAGETRGNHGGDVGEQWCLPWVEEVYCGTYDCKSLWIKAV